MNNRNITQDLQGGGNHNRNIFEQIISLENLFSAWDDFKAGKGQKVDIQDASVFIEDKLFLLHEQLLAKTYTHQGYTSFYVHDPKLRRIHKAQVIDRIVHHAIVRVIEPLFERKFEYDSYSSRVGKGVHKAVTRFHDFAWKVSRNNTKTVWVLKCDVRKFFDSIDHAVLMRLLYSEVDDENTLHLLWQIVTSFAHQPGKGLPLGNLTSQLFSNIYLHRLDHYMKRVLRVANYIRYADDFVIISDDRTYLEGLISKVRWFLDWHLKLELHPHKITLDKWHAGIDFLGYISFPHHRLLRGKTRKRMLRNVAKHPTKSVIQSAHGVLAHCNGHNISLLINTHHAP